MKNDDPILAPDSGVDQAVTEHRFSFALGPSVGAVTPGNGFKPRIEVSKAELFELLMKHEVRESKDGTYICRPMGGDGNRSDANALPSRLVPIDIDGLRPAELPVLERWIEESGFEAIMHSTHSHQHDQPKVRLWLNASRDITSNEHAWVYAAFAKRAPFRTDPCTAKPSQPIFLPSCPAARKAEAFARAFHGAPLDVDRLLDGYHEQMQQEQDRRAERVKSGGTGVRQSGGLIDFFNRSFSLHELLARHGYRQKRHSRYIAPGSRSKRDAVVLLNDGFAAISFHDPEHDPLAVRDPLGRAMVLDAFAVFCKLDHADVFNSAVNGALKWALSKGWTDEARQFFEESKAIGAGTEPEARAPHFADLNAMLDEAILVSDGSHVTLRTDPRIAWAWPDFQKLTAAYTVNAGLKGRPMQLSNAWLRHPGRRTVHTRTFKAGGPLFCQSPDDVPAVNTWREPLRVAAPTDWRQRASLFLKHLDFLVPEATERELLLDWLAHMEQQPGVLPHWHFLLFTTQHGIGRNWLSSVLARVWAGSVALDVDLVSLLDGGFNGRLSRKILAVVNEIREGAGPNAHRHANRLRTLLTDEHRLMNPKYGRQFLEFNAVRWLMFSNHENAIPLDCHDRRMVVIRNPDQPQSPSYYTALYAAAKEPLFIASVRETLRSRAIPRFNPGMLAPLTRAKQAVIDASASEAELTMRELVQHYPSDCVTGRFLGAELFGPDADRLQRAALKHVARAAGAQKYHARISVSGVQARIWILRNHQQWMSAPTDAICAEVMRGTKAWK